MDANRIGTTPTPTAPAATALSAEHSPLPWAVEAEGRPYVVDANGTLIMKFYRAASTPSGIVDVPWEANVARIKAALAPQPAGGVGLGLETTPAMRDRLRELSTRGDTDDYDRVVLLLLSDFARLMVVIGCMADAQQRATPRPSRQGGEDAFRAEIARIADDYHPDRPQDAEQALSEMRDALSASLGNVPPPPQFLYCEDGEFNGPSYPEPEAQRPAEAGRVAELVHTAVTAHSFLTTNQRDDIVASVLAALRSEAP